MGAVYLGVHSETGEEAAIKTVIAAQANELAAIRTEIAALRRLRHPAIVRIVDTGVAAGSPWYAMERLRGATLQEYARTFWSEFSVPQDDVPRSRIENAATMTHHTGAAGLVMMNGRVISGAPVAAGKLREALTLVYRLCAPLAYLHQLGIVHRDLKPANVFVRPDGRPVLMDFGLVSRFGAEGRDVLEIAGTLAGTAAYMAPEQILRHRVDARSDLYALGCMLFELLTARPPFLAESVGDLLQRHLTEPPLPPSQIVTGVPQRLDDLVLGLLAKNVRERIGHADDVSGWLVDLGAEPDPVEESSEETPPAYLYRPQLAGRTDVLDSLGHHLRQLHAGMGGLVLVAGESGVGKTSVVAELARHATVQQIAVVAGECQPIGGGVLHPLVPLLTRIVDRAVEGGPHAVARLFGERARVLAAVEPSLTRLPGFGDLAPLEELPADAARARLLADLRETIAAFTEERPVLLVLDDLQWADALTLEFLLTTSDDFLAANALLTIGTYRSEEQSRELRELVARPFVTRIDLGRLDASAVGAMIGDMLALADPPPPFIEFVAGQSEGNPFFVAEYLRTAVADRLLQRVGGKWMFGAAADAGDAYERLPLSASLRELVGRRLSGLPVDAHTLVQIASVLGREIDAALLLEASRMPESAAMEAIRELAARQVLERVDGGRYRFLHDKLRETAYASIANVRLPALHRQAAESVEALYRDSDEFPRFFGSLALHYERAAERRHAIDYYEKAAQHAAQAFADREVVEYFSSALRLDEEEGKPSDPTRRNGWRTAVGIALRGLGEQERSRAALEQSLVELGHPVPGRSLLTVAPLILRELAFRRSLSSAPIVHRQSDPEAERALNAYNFIAMIAYHERDVPGQLFSNFAALRLAPRVGPSAAAAQLYATAANVFGFMALPRLARRYAALSKQIAAAAGQALPVGIVHQYSAHLAALLADLPAFDADIRHALDTYTRIGHQRFREEALTNIAHVQGLRGQLTDSLQTFQEVERSGRARNDPQTRTWGIEGAGRVQCMLGRLDAALSRFDEAVGTTGDDLTRLDGLAWGALARAQAGDSEAARAGLAQLLSVILRAPTTSYTNIWSYSNALEAAFLVGSIEEARKILGAFRRFARIIPLARPRVQLWTGVLAAHEGRHRRARREWSRALDGARRIGLPWDEALAHFWIGRSLAGTDGAHHLAQAIRAFEPMQAAWHVASARRLLENPGATEREA